MTVWQCVTCMAWIARVTWHDVAVCSCAMTHTESCLWDHRQRVWRQWRMEWWGTRSDETPRVDNNNKKPTWRRHASLRHCCCCHRLWHAGDLTTVQPVADRNGCLRMLEGSGRAWWRATLCQWVPVKVIRLEICNEWHWSSCYTTSASVWWLYYSF